MGPFIPETNPMAQSSPQWAKWFDMLKEQAGGRRIRMAPQPGGEGSQFRGYSQQPTSLRGLTATNTGYTPGASLTGMYAERENASADEPGEVPFGSRTGQRKKKPFAGTNY